MVDKVRFSFTEVNPDLGALVTQGSPSNKLAAQQSKHLHRYTYQVTPTEKPCVQ
jgi:hypothetical protein